jgi:energy-converting hydrogenase B subunit Q
MDNHPTLARAGCGHFEIPERNRQRLPPGHAGFPATDEARSSFQQAVYPPGRRPVQLQSEPPMPAAPHSLVITTADVPGVLSRIAGAIAAHPANIRSVQSLSAREGVASLHLEVDPIPTFPALVDALRGLEAVHSVEPTESLLAIYGKRVIIIGGGAQVGQVAVGAISEADRHNIRGERISVDTIPLVGEQNLAAAVRAVARLPRAQVLVLAGAIMGGAITEAVRELQHAGIVVIALNMVGSVRDAADLVVTDPLQAGVMAVMAIADTAQFDVGRQKGRQY